MPNPLTSSDTPHALGYHLPAEWEPHETTWISWPHNREDWPDRFGPIPWVYVDFVRQLALAEPVSILIRSGKLERQATELLDRAGVPLDQVRFVRARTNRSWTRDFVPSFVVNPGLITEPTAIVAWKFNGWAKYDNHQHDAQIPKRLAKHLTLRRFVPEIEVEGSTHHAVLEGGAIDSNGLGTLLTTEECLLSTQQERNPGLDREAYERLLFDQLGIRRVIWLGRGIEGDDTHGHVDDLARFVGPKTVVTVVENDPDDPNYPHLLENLKRLEAATDQDGEPLEVVTLPMPRPVVFEGQRLPASYANFYIANGLVLVPTFNDPADRTALDILSRLFPDRTVSPVYARDLVWGLGTLHCMTHEQPAAR
jgi:agmatine deiminase